MNRTARVSSGLLDRIVRTKEEEVALLRADAAVLTRSAHATPHPADFAAALRTGPRSVLQGAPPGGFVTVIGEVKRRSPSAGAIREAADPAATASAYERGGVSAISVLTDTQYFGGSLADLRAVTAAVGVPVLRKDFTIDALQILEARVAGASAVLLIVRLLDGSSLRSLRETAESLGMAALVEAHDGDELEMALSSGATIVGINNRDLDTLTIDLAVSAGLIPRIPSSCIAVAESGIRSEADVAMLATAGADAILVGETLMRDGDPAAGAAMLSHTPRTGRA